MAAEARQRKQHQLGAEMLKSSTRSESTSSVHSGLASTAGAVSQAVRQELSEAVSSGAASRGSITNGHPVPNLNPLHGFPLPNQHQAQLHQQAQLSAAAAHILANGHGGIGHASGSGVRQSATQVEGFFSNGLHHPASHGSRPRSLDLPQGISSQGSGDLSFPTPSADFIDSLYGYLNGAEAGGAMPSDLSEAFMVQPSGAEGPVPSCQNARPMLHGTSNSFPVRSASTSSGVGSEKRSAQAAQTTSASAQAAGGLVKSNPAAPRGKDRSSSKARGSAAAGCETMSGAATVASPDLRDQAEFSSQQHSLTDDQEQPTRHRQSQSLKMRTQSSSSARRPSLITDVLSSNVLNSQPRNGFSTNHSQPVVLKGSDLAPGYSAHAPSDFSHEYMLTSPKFIPPKLPPAPDDLCLSPEVPIVEVRFQYTSNPSACVKSCHSDMCKDSHVKVQVLQ